MADPATAFSSRGRHPSRSARVFRPGAIAILLFLGVSAVTEGDEVDKLVAHRLSPGVVALFATHTQDPRIAARLKTALTDDAAPVRAVAARVVAVGRIAGLFPDVKDALEKETDANAAKEEIRALCVAGGAAADPAALVAAKRFSPRLDGTYAQIVAGLRGVEALPLYFSTLRSMALSAAQRRSFFRRVADRDGQDALTAGGSYALSRRSREDWAAILAVASEREASLAEGVLLAAIRGTEGSLRGEAAWYMAKAYQKRLPEKREEILKAVTEANPLPDPELRFGVEVLERVLGKPAVEDEDWIASLKTTAHCHLDSDFAESPLVEVLTERERDALFWRNEANRTGGIRKGLTSAGQGESEGNDLRLITGLPAGSSADLIAVGGCRSTNQQRWYGVANVEFGSSDLPRHVSLLAAPRSSDCRRTAEAMFLLSTAVDDEILGRGPRRYVALFDPECLICNEDSLDTPGVSASDQEIVRVRGKVLSPILVKRVEPFYPWEARRQHQEGINIYEAIITQTGCVRSVRLVRGSHPLLDLTGMDAVARWRYKPASLDRRPVSVYFTVTVTYSLHKAR